MKKSLSPYFVLTFILITVILTFITIIFTIKTKEVCNTQETLPTSVNIKFPEGRKYIGFDLNKQNLTFGTLSPGAMAKRSVYTEYTKNATAYVWAEGNISSWIIISPKKFEIGPDLKKEIIFTLLAPATAKEGEYGGRVIFCYLDKLPG